MKLFGTLLIALLVSADAFAYTSAQGNDPNLGNYDTETKVVVKSETATYSDAITRGHGLFYSEDELTGLYKVTRTNANNGYESAAQPYTACIAARDVETGDVAGFPCVTRGYVDYAIYDATAPILEGGNLCVGSAATVKGKLISCGSGVSGRFISLEQKMSGSGSNLKVRVRSE